MKKLSKLLGIIALVAIIGFSMAACDGGGGGGGTSLPQSSGTNEVLGKTLYLDWDDTIVFANTGTTFEVFDYDELYSEGSYSYNSTNKTITLAIEYIYPWWYGNDNKTKMNKTQAVNAGLKVVDDQIAYIRANFDAYLREMVAWEIASGENEFWSDWNNYNGPMDEDEFALHWLEEKGFDINEAVSEWKTENNITNADSYLIRFYVAPYGLSSLNAYKALFKGVIESEFTLTTYDYQIATDGSLLAQEKLPANKGTNELQGKTFSSDGWDLYGTYSFTTNIYTSTDDWYDPPLVVTGTYTYDTAYKFKDLGGVAWYGSNKIFKVVWFKPTTISGQTMLQYYENLNYSDAVDNARETNGRFWVYRQVYSLDSNIIGRRDYDDDDNYSYSSSESLNRSVLNVPQKKSTKLKPFNLFKK